MIRKYPVDQHLKNDCHLLCHLDKSQLLLMDNVAVLWFILVPDNNKIEWYELPENQQLKLNQTINLLSRFIKHEMHFDKVNIATIGNIVEQMHIHVVGRKKSDTYWPEVVWGKAKTAAYTVSEVGDIRQKIQLYFDVESG